MFDDFEISAYLSTRPVANDFVPDELYSLATQICTNLARAAFPASDAPNIQFSILSTLEKRSEYIRTENAYTIVHDQYMFFQVAFLNRCCFKPPKEIEILPFVRNLQAQRLLSHDYLNAAEFLFRMAILESRHFNSYIESVNEHLSLTLLQETFAILHEFMHVLCECSPHHQSALRNFRDLLASDYTKDLVKTFSSIEANQFVYTQYMNDTLLQEEIFCDIMALNLICMLWNSLFNPRGIQPHTLVISTYQFFNNTGFIFGIDDAVDEALNSFNGIDIVGRQRVAVDRNVRNLIRSGFSSLFFRNYLPFKPHNTFGLTSEAYNEAVQIANRSASLFTDLGRFIWQCVPVLFNKEQGFEFVFGAEIKRKFFPWDDDYFTRRKTVLKHCEVDFGRMFRVDAPKDSITMPG